jgi:orotate phosphoribosyltransferase
MTPAVELTASTCRRPGTMCHAESVIEQTPPVPDAAAKTRLAELVRELAVVHGRVTLSSGREADYYVDLRRATLHHEAGPLIGILLRQLTADWEFAAVGGLTLGADPVATAVMHAPGRPIDAFVVRKAAKEHGMQRQIEGPDVIGRRVLVVEDTTTTGASPIAAVDACRTAGAEVVGVATIVDRATGAEEVINNKGLPYRYLLGLGDLGLD